MESDLSPEDIDKVYINQKSVVSMYRTTDLNNLIKFESSIGLIYLESSLDIDEDIYVYKIVDHEKFFLAKIQYGF